MPQIWGYILDANTKEPLPGTTLIVLSPYFIPYIGTTTQTDNTGFFVIDNDKVQSTNKLLVTHATHKQQIINISKLEDYIYITNDDPEILLQPNVKTLPMPTVYSTTHPKKDNTALYLLLGGLFLLTIAKDKKKAVGKIQRSDVMLIGMAVAGVMGFSVVNKLLIKLGIFTSPEAKVVQQEMSDPGSPFKSGFWNTAPGGGAKILHESEVQDYIYKIYHALGFFHDDFDTILGIFSRMKTQSQVSYLSDKFYQRYKVDLLGFLNDGNSTLNLPWDGLTSSHIKRIVDLVYSLPKYFAA